MYESILCMLNFSYTYVHLLVSISYIIAQCTELSHLEFVDTF